MNVFNQGNSFFSNFPPAVKNLLTINVLVFIGMIIDKAFMVEHFALFYPESPFFRPWQILTHMFMHDGFFHILFNMYTLIMFGTVLEHILGTKKFLLLYFVSALGAVLLHFFSMYVSLFLGSANIGHVAYVPTLGASGAIAGVVIAYVLMYPNSILMLIIPPIPMKAKYLAIIFILAEILMGIMASGDGVAHFAHLGGILFGFLLMFFWKKTNRIYDRSNWF